MSELKKFDAEADNSRAVTAHVVPFVAWIFLMHMLGDPSGMTYAIRTVVCVGIFLGLRPWRWYPAFQLRNLPISVAVGIAVFVIWVFPESPWMPAVLRDFYMKHLMLPFFKLPEPLTEFVYAPEVCGWPLSLVRLAGSAFVIAIIEEFFWRGFLYRWMLGRYFLDVDHGQLRWGMLVVVSIVFGFEHARWFAGIIAGLAYALLYVKTRDIWAASIAHVITNMLLGQYVLITESYMFW
jgi:uncharacterized protein